MYILVDRERLVFLHKHPEFSVVTNLATLEASQNRTSVFPNQLNMFPKLFTDLEIKLLFENTTGEKLSTFSHGYLRDQIFALACRLPVSDVNAFEVAQQAVKIKWGDKTLYKYVKGAYVARAVDELFEFVPLVAKMSDVPIASPVAAPTPPARVQQAPKSPHPAPQFTQPLPTWHPAFKRS